VDWRPRFRNLNTHTHNNLRISRILVSLGELGFGRWKRPLLEAFGREIMDQGLLPACRESFHRYWTPLVMNTAGSHSWYARKTKETAEDEEESVFFQARARARGMS
jgi:hypothetical protein